MVVALLVAVFVIGANVWVLKGVQAGSHRLHELRWALAQLTEQSAEQCSQQQLQALELVTWANTSKGRRIPVVTYLPSKRRVPALNKRNLLQLALEHRIDIATTCGGSGSCGMCAILVHSGQEFLTPKNPVEVSFLGGEQDGSKRLACQCRASGPVTVEGMN